MSYLLFWETKLQLFTIFEDGLAGDSWHRRCELNAEEKYGSRRKLELLCRNYSIADFASGNLGCQVVRAATYLQPNDDNGGGQVRGADVTGRRQVLVKRGKGRGRPGPGQPRGET